MSKALFDWSPLQGDIGQQIAWNGGGEVATSQIAQAQGSGVYIAQQPTMTQTYSGAQVGWKR